MIFLYEEDWYWYDGPKLSVFHGIDGKWYLGIYLGEKWTDETGVVWDYPMDLVPVSLPLIEKIEYCMEKMQLALCDAPYAIRIDLCDQDRVIQVPVNTKLLGDCYLSYGDHLEQRRKQYAEKYHL